MDAISAIILAGGRASRMGGVDKGLITIQNKTFIQHIMECLKPQVDEILINANREIAQYQKYNLPVFQDLEPDFIGPLAGFQIGLQHCKYDYLLTIPCDSPFIPNNLATRLMQSLLEKKADIAVAKSDDSAHPVFSLMKKTVLPSLISYLAQGERKVSAWQKCLEYIEVEFNDCSEAFINLNTFEELDALALKLGND